MVGVKGLLVPSVPSRSTLSQDTGIFSNTGSITLKYVALLISANIFKNERLCRDIETKTSTETTLGRYLHKP